MKKRIITPRREILAKDVNDLNDFIEDNFIVYSRDILGVSDGIAQGLTLDSFTALNIIIEAGVAFSNGKFYESLTNTTLTLPSTNGVYKIYALKSSTSDLPISGYVLLDTSTRQETYDAVNSRTYDSLTLGYTLGSVPSNAFLLGEATVSGSIITAYDDQRTLTSIGNLASNSIQAFSETTRNYGTSENEITGFIFDQTDIYKPFVKVTINNSFEGKAIVIDNGTNAGSQGIYNIVRGNIGTYTAFSGSNGIGSYSELSNNNIGFATNSATSGTTIGFRATNADVGFKSVNSTVGLKIESDSSSVSGIQIIGSNSGLDKGVEITDTYEGIVLENNNHNDIKIIRDNVGGAVISSTSIVLDLTNNDSDSATRFYFGIAQDLHGKNIAGNVVKFHPMALDSMMLGYGVEGNSSYTATIGFDGGGLARGINLEDNAVAVNILPYANQNGVVIEGDGIKTGIRGIDIIENSEPIVISNPTLQASKMIELQGKEKSSSSSNGIFINNVNIGTEYDNVVKAIKINSTATLGISIYNVISPISITNGSIGTKANMIQLTGYDNTSNSSTALLVNDVYKALSVEDSYNAVYSLNNEVPIYIDNTTNTPTNGQITLVGAGYGTTNANGIHIASQNKGINIASTTKYGLYIEGTNSASSTGVEILDRKKPIKITNDTHFTSGAMIELSANTSSNGIEINTNGDYGITISRATRGIDISASSVEVPLRFYKHTSLPASPQEGDCVIGYGFLGGSTYSIALYLDSTWRFADLTI